MSDAGLVARFVVGNWRAAAVVYSPV